MEQVLERSNASGKSREHRFFTTLAIVIAAAVFIGFAPSYYLKPVFGVEPASGGMTLAHHLHGLIFSLWIVFLVTQTLLVARKRTDLHRRLGMVGLALAVMMVMDAFYLQVRNLKQGVTVPGVPATVFFGIAFADLVVFGALLSAGFSYRRRPDVHKRLMMLATISLLTPATARFALMALTFIPVPGIFLGWLILDLLILVLAVFDYRTLGRLHRATIFGGLFVLLSEPMRLVLAGTGPWRQFAEWLTQFS